MTGSASGIAAGYGGDEESVIYPQARIRMMEASRRDMRRAMAGRR